MTILYVLCLIWFTIGSFFLVHIVDSEKNIKKLLLKILIVAGPVGLCLHLFIICAIYCIAHFIALLDYRG